MALLLWHVTYCVNRPEQGIKLLGLLLTGSTGQRPWQVEMGWPDIHWLARDLGWAGGSRLFELGQELEYAVGA